MARKLQETVQAGLNGEDVDMQLKQGGDHSDTYDNTFMVSL